MRESALRVALFVHRYPPAVGGAELYAERLATFCVEAGDDVTVWTSTAVELSEMWRTVSREAQPSVDFPPVVAASLGMKSALGSASRLTVRRFPPLTFPARRYVLKTFSLVPVPAWQALTLPANPVCPGMWLAANRDSEPLDAVHAVAFPYSFPAACGLRLARRMRVPLLLTPFLHLGDPANPRDLTRRQYTSRPLRWLLRQADRVFVQTPTELRAVVDLGVPESRVVLQGLGVDVSECTGGNRAAARAAWNVGNECVIGHLANASEEKGTCDLLRAVAELTANVHVVLAGPEMPNFRRFWETYPLKHRVTRLGVLSDSAKRDFFAGIDVFALPSRSDSFGLVLLEAWANGVPNVAYRAGGPADLIRDGFDGRLAPCGDVSALADALRELATDPAKRTKFGDAGRARVPTEFCWAERLGLVRGVTESVRRPA